MLILICYQDYDQKLFPCCQNFKMTVISNLFTLYLYSYSLSNNKILDWFKLKAFADDKINVIEKLIFDFRRIENIMEKGENTG